MLHRHLTVAYRALDRKWGKPVDLDTFEDSTPCIPAVIERPATTFSSEEYLKTLKRNRPKPYSRNEEKKRSKKIKDSFSNISMSRFPSASDLGGSVSSLESGSSNLMDDFNGLIEDLKKPLDEPVTDSEASKMEAELKRKKYELESILKRLKETAFSIVEQKYRREAL